MPSFRLIAPLALFALLARAPLAQARSCNTDLKAADAVTAGQKLEGYAQSYQGLLRPESAIVSITKDINGGGYANGGIFSVVDDHGRKLALKIAGLRPEPRVVAIQELIAEYDDAPTVRGVLPPEEVDKLRERFPTWFAGKRREPNMLGVLMDEIDDGWNLKQIGRPPFLSSWSKETFYSRLDEIAVLLKRMHVTIDETQVLVRKNGDPILVDFDFAEFSPDEGVDDAVDNQVRWLKTRFEALYR